ncbi:histone deacetylase [Streptomyces sp. NPDC012769]|uniref:histone deacetylase n=1 Tax=Streptomyces sp. NPDC012769 TaxID=3364848 RepID=UPI003678BF96
MYVWYAAYGSNADDARLRHYLLNCREPAAPLASRAVELPGTLYFATESPVWGGGRGFYDPEAPGTVYARAHLITAGQFSDITDQEMYRRPGAGAGTRTGPRPDAQTQTELKLAEAVVRGRVRLGPGRYETVVCAGDIDGVPLLTFTAPWALGEVELREPSEAYVRRIAAGLHAAGAWAAEEIAAYLARCPGAAGRFTADDVLTLLAGGPGRLPPTPSGEPN